MTFNLMISGAILPWRFFATGLSGIDIATLNAAK
jgi:hypothetical protein